jgi:hypothetical protein
MARQHDDREMRAIDELQVRLRRGVVDLPLLYFGSREGVRAGPSCDRAGALETREQGPAIRWLSDRLGGASAGVLVLIVL